MTDPHDFSGSWTIDTETRVQLRLQRLEQAVSNCDLTTAVVEAEELLDEQPNHPKALRVLAECLLELGDSLGALNVYEHLGDLGLADPELLLRSAEAAYESCQLELGAQYARTVLKHSSESPEGHYYLGLCLEWLPGQSARAASAFLAAFHLEPEGFPLPITVQDSEWEKLIEKAVRQSAANVREFWSGIPFILEDLPSLEDSRSAVPPVPPNVLGLYVGTPPEDADPWLQRPEGLRLFRKNLVRCTDRADLVDSLVTLLAEEAAGWLGLPLETHPSALRI
jgi:tetratricopeptide (TPR) repeat protein